MNKNTGMNRKEAHRQSSSSHRRASNISRTQATAKGNVSRKTDSKVHKAASRKRKQSGNKLKKALLVLTCAVLLGGIFHVVEGKFSNPSVVYADEHLSDLKYKVVEIAYGDTLWSIAKENMTPGFHDINEYIDEIKECNQMTTEDIRSGSYLMIPYYEYLSADTVIVSKN